MKTPEMLSWATRCMLVLALLSIAVACSRDEWVAFESPNGDFTVTFPAEPTKQAVSVKTAVGVVDTVLFAAGSKSRSYSVSHSAYPEEFAKSAPPSEVLDGAVAGGVANAQGKLLSEVSITSDGVPGRQVRISASGGRGLVEARIFYKEGHLYTVQVTAEASKSLGENIDKFFDSFAFSSR